MRYRVYELDVDSTTREQLAARLAGGFLQLIDPDELNTAVAAALATPLGELDAIKALSGFRRAAAATLAKAWTAGLDLGVEMTSQSTLNPLCARPRAAQ